MFVMESEKNIEYYVIWCNKAHCPCLGVAANIFSNSICKADKTRISRAIMKRSFPTSERKKQLIIPFSETLKISNQSSSWWI